jgi:membrane protein
MRDIISSLLQSGLGLQDSGSILQLVDTMSIEKPNFFLELASIGILLYTCSAFMISLKRSLNEFFHVGKKSRQESNLFMEIIGFRFVGVLLLAVFALVIILFYFLQVFIFSALTSWLHWNNGFVNFSLHVLQIILTLLSNALIFTLIFKYMHNAKVSWRIARNGAIVTAILLYVSQLLIGYYLQHFFVMGQLGIANSIFIMLAWVHYSAQIVFFGAQFTYQIGKVFNERIQTDIKETTGAS